MYKIAIADDEAAIRHGLKHLLDMAEYGLDIVAEAANGAEALNDVRTHRPHILITDIRMPVMDGLALLKIVSGEFPDMKCIVLSGYDDFELVKEAMKYKVENYLLKPVDKDELAVTLEDAIRKIDEGINERMMLREGFSVLRNNVLSRLVSGHITYREFRDKAAFLGIPVHGNELQAAVVHIRKPAETIQDAHLMQYAAMNVCAETLFAAGAIVFADHEGRTAVIFQQPELRRERIEAGLMQAIANIGHYLKLEAAAAAGGKIGSFREAAHSYRQALQALDYTFTFSEDRVLFHDELERRKSAFRGLEWDDATLKSLLVACKEEELQQFIGGQFARMKRDAGIGPDTVQHVALEMWMTLVKATRRYKTDDPGFFQLKEQSFRRVYREQSVDELERLLCETAAMCASAIAEVQRFGYSRTVKAMMEYVQQHYDQELSLKTLSHLFQMSAAHLGKTFRAETGELFSDYVNRIRVEQAKHLLAQSHMKINEISEKTGFYNPNYFYTVFKKVAGVTPAEYREHGLQL